MRILITMWKSSQICHFYPAFSVMQAWKFMPVYYRNMTIFKILNNIIYICIVNIYTYNMAMYHIYCMHESWFRSKYFGFFQNFKDDPMEGNHWDGNKIDLCTYIIDFDVNLLYTAFCIMHRCMQADSAVKSFRCRGICRHTHLWVRLIKP